MAIQTFKSLRTAYKSLTVAQLYAGYYLVPAAKDRRYTIVDAWVWANTSFTSAHVTIGDGTTTAVTFLNEGMAHHVLLRAGTATTGEGTNLLAPLKYDGGIYVKADVLELAGVTLEVCVDYVVSHIGGTADP